MMKIQHSFVVISAIGASNLETVYELTVQFLGFDSTILVIFGMSAVISSPPLASLLWVFACHQANPHSAVLIALSMVIAIVPLVFAIVGLLTYVLASNPKLVEVGRLVFATSWLVVMFVLAQRTIHF